ncbi:hypothetical protein C8R44DRAFT_741588 [Mycena epipterygia]|nr:hypothetical protein C8R44DRAFT_741588 [Mycena epipterygia]
MHISFASILVLALVVPALGAPVPNYDGPLLDKRSGKAVAKPITKPAAVAKPAAPIPAAHAAPIPAVKAPTLPVAKGAAIPAAGGASVAAPKAAVDPTVKTAPTVGTAPTVNTAPNAPVSPTVKTPVSPAAAGVPVAAVPAVKSTLPVAKASAVSAAQPLASASAKPAKCKPVKAPKLSHPSATGTGVHLFHGTTSAGAAALVSTGPLIAPGVGDDQGDFHNRPDVEGAFYMSDSVMASAQFACYESTRGSPAQVDVLEYEWNGAGLGIKEFPSTTDPAFKKVWFKSNPSSTRINFVAKGAKDKFFADAQAIFKNSMITGPMQGIEDFDLSKSIFQYAIVHQEATANLKLIAHHQNLLCKNIPKKGPSGKFSDVMYAQGQGGTGDPVFDARVTKTQDPAYDFTTDCTLP